VKKRHVVPRSVNQKVDFFRMFINERYDFVGISRNNLPGLDYVGIEDIGQM